MPVGRLRAGDEERQRGGHDLLWRLAAVHRRDRGGRVEVRDSVLHSGPAWVTLCIAFGIHVVDEALTDFLSVYTPMVRAVRARFPFLPLPTFTFRVWLSGLVLAIVVLASLTPFAYRGAAWMRPVAFAFGIVMAGDGVVDPFGPRFTRPGVAGN